MSANTRKNKTTPPLRTQGGFIALISAILISVSLLVLVVSVGFGGFFGRFAILDSEVKEVSNYLAEACVNTAIIELVQDDEYAGGVTVFVDGNPCEIIGVAPTGSWPKTIEVQAIYNDAYTNLEVEVDESAGNIVVTSWLELPSFP